MARERRGNPPHPVLYSTQSITSTTWLTMSYTKHTSTATCTLAVKTEREAIDLFIDWVTNNPDEYPESIADLTSEELADEVSPYISINDAGDIVVSVDTDGDLSNYNSEVFNCISRHFATIQTSDYMTVNWSCYDSKAGTSSGTDYYDQDGNAFDMHDKSKDSKALDQIAAVLSGTSWDVDMLMSISDIITGTGRVIEEV